MKEHWVGERVNVEVEAPFEVDPASAVRREALRCDRFLPGLLKMDDGDYEVTCLDVGFGGMKVMAKELITVELGDVAALEIRMGQNVFEDDCLIVGTEEGPDGTILNLAM